MVQTRLAQRRACTLTSAAVAALALVCGAALGAAPAAAHKPGAGHCARIDKAEVRGAEHVETACLSDLTTTGTAKRGHPNPADWAGTDSDVHDRLIDRLGGGSGTATTASRTARTPTASTRPSRTGCARCSRAPAPRSAR